MNIGVITGASSGIGKEFVLRLAEKHNFDEIWLIARRGDKLKELAGI
jgi:short-subunit dehydrogenase